MKKTIREKCFYLDVERNRERGGEYKKGKELAIGGGIERSTDRQTYRIRDRCLTESREGEKLFR